MRVLALSPHTDDIELGCGGYLNKLHEQGHEIEVVVFSDCSTHWDLPLRQECKDSMQIIGVKPHIFDFESRKFNRKEVLDLLITYRHLFDLVIIPSGYDVHQDHQIVHNEAVRAFSRDCSVIGYELSWNCRGFKPNYFVTLMEKHIIGKLKMLDCYKSQIKLHRPYFDPELIRGQARNRGLQIKHEYAEAFEVITWIE